MPRPAPLIIGQLPPPSRRDRRGFALLITITLLAFLVLLLVSLASLTRVETRVAANNQNIAQARQNALLALNIALGQLQRHTGPDQRVTATADLQPLDYTALPRPTTDPASGVDLTGDTQTVINNLDTFWIAARNRRWTGAWKNGNEAPYTPTDPVAFNPTPSLQSWLVSGNELTNAFAPDDQVDNFTLENVLSPTAATVRFGTAAKPYRLLLGPGTVTIDSDDPRTIDRAVVVPEVEIKSSSVPGISSNTTIGHYAWWVGDEGVKARANIVDPYAEDTTSGALLARRQSAQRPVIEAMTTNGADGLGATYPANDEDLLNIITPAQLDYLGTDVSFTTERAARYHDLTVSSRGVLADTMHGGLKRDLSYILGRTSLGDFQQALKQAYAGVEVTGMPALSPLTTPYATPPADGTYAALLESSATWEQLWSFYNMGNLAAATPKGVFDATNAALVRLPTATQQGITPLLMQAKVFYGMEFVGGTSVDESDGAGTVSVNRTGIIRVTVTPVVVLANPYSVPLSLATGDTIRIRIAGFDPKVKAGESVSADGKALAGSTSDVKTLDDAGLGQIQLVIDSLSIPAGRAQIFTVDPDEDTVITSLTTTKEIRLKNTFDPTASLSFSTGKTMPAGKRYVALVGSSSISGTASIGDVTVTENRFSTIETKKADDTPNMNDGVLVRPFSNGTQNGGGVAFALQDGISPSPQQAQFLQLNYRSPRVVHVGSGDGHPLQWATSFIFPGVVGQGLDPHPQMSANILPSPDETDPTDYKTVRWGMVNTAGYPDLTTPPDGINPDEMVSVVNLLYDVPQPGTQVTSLGQLQHFNLGGYENALASSSESIKANGWQVNYPIGNSYPTPRVTRRGVFHRTTLLGPHYDGAYMWNDILWDRFHFSSFPQSGDFDFDNEDDHLVNARNLPFRDTVQKNDPAQFRGVYKAAENLLVAGAFNVNSTSVEAWKAILSGLKNVPIGSENEPGNLSAPFTRILKPAGGASNAEKGVSVNAWSGFRNLEQEDINAIAREMVLQVRMRGPFLSLSQFVNRKLTAGKETRTGTSPDTLNLGLRGALQAAIDKVVNQKSDITAQAPFNEETRAFSNSEKNPYYGDLEYLAPTRISGFPGYLLQGDVLSALAPGLTARSDTFTIRTYGDVTNPATGDVEGRAWCEAVVQRMPDYVSPKTPTGGDAPDEIATDPDNIEFGRRYQIVSFRWLSPNDI